MAARERDMPARLPTDWRLAPFRQEMSCGLGPGAISDGTRQRLATPPSRDGTMGASLADPYRRRLLFPMAEETS